MFSSELALGRFALIALRASGTLFSKIIKTSRPYVPLQVLPLCPETKRDIANLLCSPVGCFMETDSNEVRVAWLEPRVVECCTFFHNDHLLTRACESATPCIDSPLPMSKVQCSLHELAARNVSSHAGACRAPCRRSALRRPR